jgi:copper chaperone CopZ
MSETIIHLDIQGMSCGGCVSAVDTALRRVAGVNSVSVDLAGNSATVTGAPDGLSAESLVAAVTDAGFDAAVRSP